MNGKSGDLANGRQRLEKDSSLTCFEVFFLNLKLVTLELSCQSLSMDS